MASNQGRPTLIFYRHREEFLQRWPALDLADERRFAFFLYPLTGGFSRRPLVPYRLAPAIEVAERILSPLAPVLAFRCLIVLQRRC
jgi:hypothetical protein